MLHFIQSNRMEILSESLAKLLSQNDDSNNLSSLLRNEKILVQSPGMSTWLRLEIAKHNGIAAALEFPLPSNFIWQLCYTLLNDVPKENPFTKPAMTWKLMSLLPQIIDQEIYAPLQQYLGDNQEIKLYQLCGKVADIFDQYLVYRPQWILDWEKGEDSIALHQEQQWQPQLWRELVSYNEHLGNSHFHRSNLHQALITCLKDPKLDLNLLPSRMFIFGISSMAPQTLDVLYQLANRIDIYMFNLSPCQHYWGDIVDAKTRARMALAYQNKKHLAIDWEQSLEVGNPLLANNGKMGREMLDMMLELEPEHMDFQELYLGSNSTNMLSGIQNDILEMETLGHSLAPDAKQYLNITERRIASKDDQSITLRSCHSPLREVETLHDHLLNMLKTQPNIEAKDIVIMLPDVATYAPFIDAVFSSKQGDHYIPYAIADRGAAQESPLIQSFLNLLQLDKSRFGLTEIISILEVPAVMAKFNLTDDELTLLKQWLNQAAVRWGRNTDSKIAQGLYPFDKNSWAFGIRRMLLGYALGDESDLYFDNLPVSGIDGQSAQALGKLLNFVEVIDELKLSLTQNLAPAQRIENLNQIVDMIYQSDETVRTELNQILQSIERFSQEIISSGYQDAISLSILRQWFNANLTESRVGQRYLAGSVNFCTLMPMRSIPFKIVCLLGMNDGVYPRIQHPVGFDLMAHNGHKRGDRSRRSDDRYLFLEALLSAREQLYISYIGHSERDNAERVPSMLVSELLEYCQLCYKPSNNKYLLDNTSNDKNMLADHGEQAASELKQQLVIEMPLQPFDAKLYNANSNTPQSFAENWCPTEQHTPDFIKTAFIDEKEQIVSSDESQSETEQNGVDEIAITSLIRFYRNPAQYFFQRTLKVNLHINLDEQENDEPFNLTPLDRHQIQSKMIQSALENDYQEVSQVLLNELKASGELPMAPFDQLTLADYQSDIAPLVDRIQYLRDDANPEESHISLNFMVKNEILLQGRIEQIYPKGLITFRPGTAKAKDFLSLYIRHLCMNANQVNKPSYLLDAGSFYEFSSLKAYKAYDLLQQLILYFEQGLTHPLMFIPETSLAYVDSEGFHNEKLSQAETKWHNDSGFGDDNDPYYQRLYTFPDDFQEATFGKTAHNILFPMISLLHKGKLKDLQSHIENMTTTKSNNSQGGK